MILVDAIDPLKQLRQVWIYVPGQRRVRQVNMPDDAPHSSSSGTYMNDDAFVYTGVLERYDLKLVGKREMIVPYNTYRLTYHPKAEDLLRPGHVNPDFVRWELHRVWVVEATLKPGEHHVYGRRVFYVDEDSWAALASDEYGLDGKLLRAVFCVPDLRLPGRRAVHGESRRLQPRQRRLLPRVLPGRARGRALHRAAAGAVLVAGLAGGRGGAIGRRGSTTATIFRARCAYA